MKIFSLSLLFFVFCPCSIDVYAQVNNDVKLLSWNGGKCDHSLNADRLVARITSAEIINKELHLTVNFSANCCTEFNPTIRFNNDSLFLFTYDINKIKGKTKVCGCDCCFSLEYVISNLNDTSFVTMLNEKRIFYSENPYLQFEIKYEVINGDTINRNNKYGTKVGLHTSKSINNQINYLTMYADDPNSTFEKQLWSKGYYQNGIMAYYDRVDSTESWYEDGKLKYLKYVAYDDENKITNKIEYYNNGQLKSKSTAVFYAEKNQKVDSISGGKIDEQYLLMESFYENGQLQSLAGDTTKSWYDDGKLKSWHYGGTKIEYYHDGSIATEKKNWKVKSAHGWRDLNYTLYLEYYTNGKMSSMRFVRDEEDQGGIAANYYDWKWDENGTLIKKPNNWNGDLPKVGDQ